MSYITHIGTANPKYQYKQAELAEFMVSAHQLEGTDAQKLKALYRASGIETRYSVLPDYGKDHEYQFLPNTKDLEPFPSTEERMKRYRTEAISLSLEAVRAATNGKLNPSSITHLVVVSCTGMYAPGLDIDLVKRLNLNTHVHRTNITFMGCYAAFSALKLADAWCKTNKDSRVLIVCTELCSLHFQKEPTENNLLANALFADGSAALIVANAPLAPASFEIESFYCDLLLNGEDHMAWRVGNLGFEMVLSSYLPTILESGVGHFRDELLARTKKPVDYYVIHPGGKRILEAVEKELGVSRDQNGNAFSVLKKFGNMSSPTVLFVLKELSGHLSASDDGKQVLCMGFGPGITLESCLLKVVSN